jgi:metallo-beta-lactamase family protein
MSTLNLICWGGVGSVTGANFLLEDGVTKLLVDCGLLQGVSGANEENAKQFPYNPAEIDFLFITHAHMDHIGRVPKLVRDGFKGVIYSTDQTRQLAQIMFADAVKIMSQNEKDGKGKALYIDADAGHAMSLWKSLPYDTDTKLTDAFFVRLFDAGHILGSAMYQFTHGGKKVFFTGDSGNSPSPLLRDTEKIAGVDYLIMDSVYGDRNHESKTERDARFEKIIRDTIANGGALVIPAFSIERTQVILYELNNLIEEKGLPSVPVFLDSPLALKVTDVYKHSTDLFNDHVQSEIKKGDDVFSFPKLKIVHSGFESQKVEDIPNPKIILAGSGMSEGGRVVHHEMTYITDPKSAILLMGYQAVGTLGRRIQDKPSSIEIDGQNFPVRAHIEMISGYSSHKDFEHLVDMVADTAYSVKKVFVVMGEPKSSMFLVQRLRDYLDVDALYPERGRSYDLD